MKKMKKIDIYKIPKYEENVLLLACKNIDNELIDDILNNGFIINSTKFMDNCENEETKRKVWYDKLEVPKLVGSKGKLYPIIGNKYYLMNEIDRNDANEFYEKTNIKMGNKKEWSKNKSKAESNSIEISKNQGIDSSKKIFSFINLQKMEI